MRRGRPPVDFWDRVDKSGQCWEWTGGRNIEGGYGQFWKDGRHQKAHRVSYEMHVGPIPAEMVVDHVCMNKVCVNPAHLRLATVKQNNEHLVGARRNSKTGVRGVSWHKGAGKWVAQVRHDGVNSHVGYFDTIEEAAEAAKARRLEVFTHNSLDRSGSGNRSL